MTDPTDTPIDGPAVAAPKPPLPDRLSTNQKSPYYNEEILRHEVGIRFNGVEKNNIEEYCVSEGWVKIPAGKARDRFGNALTITHKGKVEPYYRHEKSAPTE